MSTDTMRPDHHWYRSLYWRFALGLFAFLALMLAAEAALIMWTSDRIAGSMPARSPRRLAALVASDLGAALAAAPSQGLQQYVTDQYGHVFQSFVVIMRDGRVAANHANVPDGLKDAVPVELQRLAEFERDEQRSRGERRPQRSLPPERPWEGAVIRVDGHVVGSVAVATGPPPFSRVVQAMGPTIAVVASGVLGVGSALIALFVFAPARRRLKELQTATERLGAGDLSARAPDRGGDEVSAVARSFNRMADELRTRALALESADRMRRQLLADVSHELMTPLTAMRGYSKPCQCPTSRLMPRRASGTSGSSMTKHTASSGSSAIFSIWRDSKAEGRRCDASGLLSPRCSTACARGTKAEARPAESASCRRSSLARSTWKAIPIDSSKRCKTSPPMRSGIRRTAAKSDSRRQWPMVRSTCACAIRDRDPTRAPAADFRSVL